MQQRLRTVAMAAAALCIVALPATVSAQDAIRHGGGASGFTSNDIPRNDDGFIGPVDIGFNVNFFGEDFDQLYVNNNGNVTFMEGLATYTPFAMTGNSSNPIIAAYFADVDTRGQESALATWGQGTVDGRLAFGVNYDGVGYFGTHTDKLDFFQLILIDRSDVSGGDFDIEFNYDQMQWETGDASGGDGGMGGTPGVVGYSSGAGEPGTYYQLPGSGVSGALLDGGSHALVSNSRNSTVDGRYVFEVRNGQVQPPVSVTPEPSTILLSATGLAGLGLVAVRRRRRG